MARLTDDEAKTVIITQIVGHLGHGCILYRDIIQQAAQAPAEVRGIYHQPLTEAIQTMLQGAAALQVVVGTTLTQADQTRESAQIVVREMYRKLGVEA